MKKTKQTYEMAKLNADVRFWRRLGKPLGWKLIGWTDRASGLFLVGRESVRIVGVVRDALLMLLKNRKPKPKANPGSDKKP